MWQHHSEVLAELTLLRCKYVRSQVEDGDYVSAETLELHTRMLEYMNGDPRRPCVQHFCWRPGCCDGQKVESAVSAISDLLTSCFLRLWEPTCLPPTGGTPLAPI